MVTLTLLHVALRLMLCMLTRQEASWQLLRGTAPQLSADLIGAAQGAIVEAGVQGDVGVRTACTARWPRLSAGARRWLLHESTAADALVCCCQACSEMPQSHHARCHEMPSLAESGLSWLGRGAVLILTGDTGHDGLLGLHCCKVV